MYVLPSCTTLLFIKSFHLHCLIWLVFILSRKVRKITSVKLKTKTKQTKKNWHQSSVSNYLQFRTSNAFPNFFFIQVFSKENQHLTTYTFFISERQGGNHSLLSIFTEIWQFAGTVHAIRSKQVLQRNITASEFLSRTNFSVSLTQKITTHTYSIFAG